LYLLPIDGYKFVSTKGNSPSEGWRIASNGKNSDGSIILSVFVPDDKTNGENPVFREQKITLNDSRSITYGDWQVYVVNESPTDKNVIKLRLKIDKVPKKIEGVQDDSQF
jgi:hypothetical protein